MSGSGTSSTVQLGAYVGNPNNSDASEEAATNAQFNSLAAAMGQAPTLMDTYIDQSIPQSQWASYAQWDAASWAAESWSAPGNLTPVIGLPMADSTQTGDAAFKSIISGQYDSAILGVFQAWAAAGYTSFDIRPGWEMNGTWYNWSVNASDAADYVAAFQHIATLAHDFSGATIKVVWNPNVGSTPVPLSSLYPGNASVDVVGLDTYGAPVDSGDPPGNTSTSSSTITLLDALALAKANNKPFALPETGGLDANFAQQLGSVVAQSGVQVAFVNLWDIDDTSGNLSFSNASDNESAVAAAWKQAFATISAANGTSGTGQTSVTISAPTPTPGTSDILLVDPTAGTVSDLVMNNGQATWTPIGWADPSCYQVVGVGNITGGATADIVLSDASNGAIGAFVMNDNTPTWQPIGQVNPSFQVAGVGDFTGSGTDDILFIDQTTGQLGDFLMSGGQPTWESIGYVDPSLQVVGVGKFDGGTTDDILFRDPTSGALSEFTMNNNHATWAPVGWADPSLQVVGVGDFTGNGTDDILFRDPTTGVLSDFLMNNGTPTWQVIGTADPSLQVVATGDYTGNGTDDILFRDPATGGISAFMMHNNQPTWTPIGCTATNWQVAT